MGSLKYVSHSPLTMESPRLFGGPLESERNNTHTYWLGLVAIQASVKTLYEGIVWGFCAVHIEELLNLS